MFLIVSFVLCDCDIRRFKVLFEKGESGAGSECLSAVQSSYAVACAFRSEKGRDQDTASVESKMVAVVASKDTAYRITWLLPF